MKVKRTTLAKALMGAVLGAATIFAAPVQAKDWKTVTIALEGGYEPWNLTLPGGKLGGFEPSWSPTSAPASRSSAISSRKTGTA